MALRQRNATLPGVSLPSSVVRSVIDTINLRPSSLAEVLMLRRVKAVARSSAITWSTVGAAQCERSRGSDLGVKRERLASVFKGGTDYIHCQRHREKAGSLWRLALVHFASWLRKISGAIW